MATLPEEEDYVEGVYQLETTDPALGGPPNRATKAGVLNIPLLDLANRTNWLKARVDGLLASVQAATDTIAGVVRLSTATNSTATDRAATPSAVKAAMDNANARVPNGRTVSTSGLATGGGDLSANRTISVPAATEAEARAGAATNRALTPQGAGWFLDERVASPAEAATGSSGKLATVSGAVSAVTGLFGGDNAQLSATGFTVLPGGLTLQWGVTADLATDQNVVVTFPRAFATACFVIIPTTVNANTGNDDVFGRVITLGPTGATLRAELNGQSGGTRHIRWLAIGV